MSVLPIVGIDLGRTKSCAAIIRDSKVEMVSDGWRSRIIPSYVAYPPNGNPVYMVGKFARNKMRINPAGVIFDCKRLIGMAYTDPIVEEMKEYVPFAIIDDGNNKPMVRVVQNGKNIDKRPEEIEAMILRHLQKLTSEHAECDINKVVITVPAYFDQCQRQATKDAGVIAGLDVVDIIPEPVAAAYAYADQNMNSNDEKTVMIYDLGGGAFNVTIVSMNGLQYKVLGLNGDLFGGSDFDTLIMNEVYKTYLADGNEELNQRKRSKLRFTCEEAKMALKAVPEYEIFINDWVYVLTQTKLALLLKPMIQKTIDLCKRTLADCGKTIDDISDIILVGGSSRLNIVHEMLEKEFPKKMSELVNPDECVAYGAVKYAYFLSQRNNAPNHEIRTVHCPSNVSITMNGTVLTTLCLEQSLPFEKAFLFVEHSPVTTMWIYVSEIDSQDPMITRTLRIFMFQVPPPLRTPDTIFKIMLRMDERRFLSIRVIDEKSGMELVCSMTSCVVSFEQTR